MISIEYNPLKPIQPAVRNLTWVLCEETARKIEKSPPKFLCSHLHTREVIVEILRGGYKPKG